MKSLEENAVVTNLKFIELTYNNITKKGTTNQNFRGFNDILIHEKNQ